MKPHKPVQFLTQQKTCTETNDTDNNNRFTLKANLFGISAKPPIKRPTRNNTEGQKTLMS